MFKIIGKFLSGVGEKIKSVQVRSREKKSKKLRFRKKIIISSFILISGALIILGSLFTNKSISCQDKRTDKLSETLQYLIVTSPNVGAIATVEMLGRQPPKDFVGMTMNAASESQQKILNVLRNKSCNNWIFWAQLVLIISFLINIFVVIFSIFSKTLSRE